MTWGSPTGMRPPGRSLSGNYQVFAGTSSLERAQGFHHPPRTGGGPQGDRRRAPDRSADRERDRASRRRSACSSPGGGRGGLCPVALFPAIPVSAESLGDRRLLEPSRGLASYRRRKTSTSPPCSRTTPRSTAPFSPACSISPAPSVAAWDYALMPATGLEPKGEAVAKRGEFSLVRPHSPPLRAIGQLVSRKAAERLLALTEPFDRPVDTFLQMSWVTGAPLLAFTPTPGPRRVARDRRDDRAAEAHEPHRTPSPRGDAADLPR